MGDIVIIGGGVAGLQAAGWLARRRSRLGGRRVLLIDAKATSDFLPVLPDVAAGRVGPEHVSVDLEAFLARGQVNFQRAEVVKVDPAAREVGLKGGDAISYEFLVIACGTVTNFYGMAEVQRRGLTLDTAQDAALVANVAQTYPGKKILVVGGGYTGVEIASHLAVALRRRKIRKYDVHIIEKGEDILGPLPDWIKDYCRTNLGALRVSVHDSCSIGEISDKKVILSNGMVFEDYLLVWSAGVQTPSFVRDLPYEKDGQGRLKVDRSLALGPNVFAAGDAASFVHRGRPLRMAIQFSIAEGVVAARNILRLIEGRQRLLVYRPVDLGWLVPLANRKACGIVLGVRVWGIVGWVLHYSMCIYRSLTLGNQWGLARDVFLRFR